MAEQQILQECQREPTVAEIAARLKTDTTHVADVRRVAGISQPKQAHPDARRLRLIRLVAASEPSPDEWVIEHERVRALIDALAMLDARTTAVILLRFGLGGTPVHSYRELADQTGLNVEDIRQIQRRGIEKLADTPSLRRAVLMCPASRG